MESLFLFRDHGSRKRKEYVRTYSDLIASGVQEDEGKLLTLIALSDGDCLLTDEEEASLSDRALIERKKDGSLKVTETGMKAVSVYPLMGSPSMRKSYPSAFFPMLMSLIASGELSSHHALYSRYLSSDLFTSRFPRLEREAVSEAAVQTVRAMDELGLLRHDGGRISIDRENAEAFMALPLSDRLSYMIHPEFPEDERKRFSRTIQLLEFLSSYPENDISGLLATISRVTGYDASDDLGMLETFSFIYRNDGLVYASDITENRAENAVISSDFTITAEGRPDAPLYLFAEPLKDDIAEQWIITRTSAKAAFSMGLTDKDIMKELRKITSLQIPEMIGSRIASWYGSFSSLKCIRALVIYADDKNARVMDALPTLSIHILSKLSDNVFIMNPSKEEEWRKILRTAGFDMLGRTEGWELREVEKKAELLRAERLPEIPFQRAVPFDHERRKAILEDSHDVLRRTMVESGFILTADTETPAVDMVNGLYYQEKVRLITSAMGRNIKVYAEMAEGSIIIGRATKAEEPGHVMIDDTCIDMAKIWKAALLPLSVRSAKSLRDPSDSDTL